MNSHTLSSSSSSYSYSSLHFLFLILLLRILYGSCQSDELYDKCENKFSCGNVISGVGYPFRGSNDPLYCGNPNLVLNCDTQTNVTTIDIMGMKYRVLEIDQPTQTMRVAREDVMVDGNSSCPREKRNTTLDHSVFDYAPGYTNVTFMYGCPPVTNSSYYAPAGSSYVSNCGINNDVYDDDGAYVVPGVCGPGECTASVVVPVPDGDTNTKGRLGRVLRQGFRLTLKIGEDTCNECVGSNGRCGYDVVMNRTACYCRYPPYFTYNNCSVASGVSPNTTVPSRPAERSRSSSTTRRDIALSAVGAVLAGIGFGWLVFYFRNRRKRRIATQSTKSGGSGINPLPSGKGLWSHPSNNLTTGVASYLSSKSDIGQGSSYFGVKVFNCAELEEATNNFDPSRELGGGGFGTVYLASLSDGCTVAVKRLYEHNFKRLEQYMNEVEILTRLRHQNLVKLHGCTSRRSRELLLVYEYIPNGTVAEHLHGTRAKSGLLSWPIRLNIAVETADALAYLHKSGIIHRDVKTNNILLDSDFHVKVVDFGLSRLFPNGASHITTAPQGTPGYVDPDYYQCYKLTEKSDVYSFGVVLIELISSLEAVDTERHRHDINLSSMAISKILNRALHELVDPGLGFGTDDCVSRMVMMVAEVAFRCLQQERDMRPSMEEVLRDLRGIQKEGLDAHEVEIVDITDDDVELLKGIMVPASPDSGDKWPSGSTPAPDA